MAPRLRVVYCFLVLLPLGLGQRPSSRDAIKASEGGRRAEGKAESSSGGQRALSASKAPGKAEATAAWAKVRELRAKLAQAEAAAATANGKEAAQQAVSEAQASLWAAVGEVRSAQQRALYQTRMAARPRSARLEHFRNLHRGEDVYVVASGKSFDFLEHDFFDGRVVIGVNQVYRRLPMVPYLVRKEEIATTKMRRMLRELPNTTHFVGRGSRGNDLWDNAKVVFDNFSDNERVVLFDHPPSWTSFSIAHRRVLPPASSAKLIISGSTLGTAIHLAAYMGARRIFLVGHDCGTIDGQASFANYHDEASLGLVWNNTAAVDGQSGFGGDSHDYKKWLTDRYTNWLTGGWGGVNIENDTLALKSLLREQYGVSLHSINPFINFGLEGHVYARGAAPQQPQPPADPRGVTVRQQGSRARVHTHTQGEMTREKRRLVA